MTAKYSFSVASIILIVFKLELTERIIMNISILHQTIDSRDPIEKPFV